MVFITASRAAPIIDNGSPLGFFTNVASRLLASELSLDLTRIQIYPANQYTPAVQRLLQVSANLYDATTANFYPTVFRPTFWVTNESGCQEVYISGYQQVVLTANPPASDPQLGLPVDVASLPPGASADNYPYGVNVYGIPWIIGAKKGFPNFNKFAMQNVVSITRKLQIRRRTVPITAITDLVSTNQLYIFSVSNSIGIDCWNSYSNAYPNPVQIVVNDNLTMQLTNDWPGTPVWNPPTFSINANILVAGWPGSAPWVNRQPYQFSFQVPTNISYQFLTNSGFYFNQGNKFNYVGFVPTGFNPGWDTNKVNFTFPHFGLLTTNRLQVFMLDGSNIIDYVQFAGPDSSRDLNAEIQTNATGMAYENMWSTNLTYQGVPWGIASQIGVSEGNPQLNTLYWNDPSASSEILGFNAFMTPNSPTSFGNDTVADYYATNYIVQVPYTPTVSTYLYTSWQANDPLVHYLTSDLNFYGTEAYGTGPTTGTNVINYPGAQMPRPSFNALNERYQPWGVINAMSQRTSLVDQNPSCLAYKDPLVRGSDNWSFPTNGLSIMQGLGQIHRGTPWQTIYLKATNILNWAQTAPPYANGISTWMYWTGDFNFADAAAMAPVRDWHVVGSLVSLLNTNDLQSLFSVNNPNPNAWLVLFDGLTALTNNLTDIQLRFPFATPQFATIVISSNSPQASVIANAIQTALASQPNQYFHDLGDILAIPQLAEQSPLLHWYNGSVYDAVQMTNGITDVAYEEIPSQLLWLLRADSIGSIAPTNGQMQVQFTGYDGHAYAVQASSNLWNWASVNTNFPINGTFNFMIPATSSPGPQFYRSVLLY